MFFLQHKERKKAMLSHAYVVRIRKRLEEMRSDDSMRFFAGYGRISMGLQEGYLKTAVEVHGKLRVIDR